MLTRRRPWLLLPALSLAMAACISQTRPDRVPVEPSKAASPTVSPTSTEVVSPSASPTASPPYSPTPTFSVSPTFSPSPTATPSATPVTLWQDFESNIITGLWETVGPSPMTSSWSADSAVSGSHSWKMETGEGVDYGHWTGLGLGRVDINLGGANTLRVWVKCDTNLTTELYWVEGLTLGADDETWGRQITITGGPAWQELVFPLSSFNSLGGNGVRDTQAINAVWFYHVVPYAAHTLYIDDIRFMP